MNKQNNNLNKTCSNLSNEELNTVVGGFSDLDDTSKTLDSTYCNNWTCKNCLKKYEKITKRTCSCGGHISCKSCNLYNGKVFDTNCSHYLTIKSTSDC